MQVLLAHSGKSDSKLKEARSWLETEGCTVVIFDLANSSKQSLQKSLTELIAECDVVVFLVDAEIPLNAVQLGAMAANAKGKEIVSVQLGAQISVDAFEKFGSASVPFKQNLVVSSVCKHDPAWFDEDGTPRDDQEMEHHKCKKPNPGSRNAAA